VKASAAAAARYEERPLPLQMSQTGSTIGAKTASCAKATKDTNQPLASLALSAPGPRVAGWRTTRYLAGQKNLHPSCAPMPDIRSHRCQISGAAIVSGHPHMSQISGWYREGSGPLARPDICPHPVPRYPAVRS
jgi:hypothetical protein